MCEKGTGTLTTGKKCPAGHYCPEGSSTGKPCPSGTYLDDIGTWEERSEVWSSALPRRKKRYVEYHPYHLPNFENPHVLSPLGFKCSQTHFRVHARGGLPGMSGWVPLSLVLHDHLHCPSVLRGVLLRQGTAVAHTCLKRGGGGSQRALPGRKLLSATVHQPHTLHRRLLLPRM